MITYHFKENGKEESCTLPTEDELGSASLSDILTYRSCANRLLMACVDKAEDHALSVLEKTSSVLRSHMESKYSKMAVTSG